MVLNEELALQEMSGIKMLSLPQSQLVGGGHREPIIIEFVYEDRSDDMP